MSDGETPTINDVGTEEAASADPEQLREEIAETRAELGKTVEALAAKADVKAQAKQKLAERKEQLKETGEQVTAKVADVRGRITDASPEQARHALGQVQQRARERPLATVAAGSFLAGLLTGWMLRRR